MDDRDFWMYQDSIRRPVTMHVLATGCLCFLSLLTVIECQGERTYCLDQGILFGGLSGFLLGRASCNRQNPCDQNPCLNGGTCVLTVAQDGTRSFQCTCARGYCGDTCSTLFPAFPAANSLACSNDLDCFEIEGTRCFLGECRCRCGRTPHVPAVASGNRFPYCAESQPCSSDELGSFIRFTTLKPNIVTRITDFAISQSWDPNQDACETACSDNPDCFTYVLTAGNNCVLSRYVPTLHIIRSNTGFAASGPSVPGGYRCAFPES